MTTKDLFTTAWNDPKNWQVEFQVDGVCYEPLPCVDFGGADETPPTLNDYFCFDKNGRPEVKGTIDNSTFDRITTTFLARFSDIQPLLLAQSFTEKGVECLFNARVAAYCKSPFTKENLMGWITLQNVSLAGGKSFGQLTNRRVLANVGAGAAGENLMTFNASITGVIPIINIATTVYVGYDESLGSGFPTAAIYQCLDAICKTGTNLCGDGEVKRGECDEWTQLRNNAADFDVDVSIDGGRTYTTDQTVTGLGNVVDADCDLIVTDTAPLELCGNFYRAVPDLPTFNALAAYDGGDAILFEDGGWINGVMVFDSAQSEWFIGQPAVDNVATFADQNAIDSDGSVMLTGGNSRAATGGNFQFSFAAGEVGSWTRADLNIAGFTVVGTDVIQEVNVHDGVMAMVLHNGIFTKVVTSFDGINWIDAGDFVGVHTFVRMRRPTDEITYLVLDDKVWANYSGLCECEWVQVQDLDPNTPNHFEICSNDPTYTHYTF